jgi:hypothetical protein
MYQDMDQNMLQLLNKKKQKQTPWPLVWNICCNYGQGFMYHNNNMQIMKIVLH